MPSTSFLQNQHPLPNSLQTRLLFGVPVLINLLQLRFQGNNSSPFETHPFIMELIFSCLLICFLGYGIELDSSLSMTAPIRLFRSAVTFSGLLLLASMSTLFFPSSFVPFIYGVSIVLSTQDFLRTSIKMLWTWNNQRTFRQFFRALERKTGQAEPDEVWPIDLLPV